MESSWKQYGIKLKGTFSFLKIIFMIKAKNETLLVFWNQYWNQYWKQTGIKFWNQTSF